MHHGQMNPSSKEGELVYPLPSHESLDFVDGTENCCAWFYQSKICLLRPSSTAKLSNLMADDTKSCPVGSRGVKKR